LTFPFLLVGIFFVGLDLIVKKSEKPA